jgi:hypothetical protein
MHSTSGYDRDYLLIFYIPLSFDANFLIAKFTKNK